MTHWFHVECAAFKRPEPFLETLPARGEQPIADAERLLAEAQRGIAHRRLPRINGAEQASSGRAECRSCRTPIAKGAWRLALVYYEDGRFAPSGFVHAGCAQEYFETTDLLARVRRFSPGLGDEDLRALQVELESPRPKGPPAGEP